MHGLTEDDARAVVFAQNELVRALEREKRQLVADNEAKRAEIAERKRSARTLKRNFAKFLAPLYLENPTEIAKACDDSIDQTGELLGILREEATILRKARAAAAD